MALYSLIQYTSTVICSFYYAYPADFQYLYWDMFGNFFFFLTFGYTGTVAFLNKNIPPMSLFSFSNLFQIIFMFAIQIIGQISMILVMNGPLGDEILYSQTGG